MKQKIYDIALQAGGSHYPTVGGDILEKFAELMLAECIKVVENTPKHCAYTTYDLSTVECTIRQSVAALRDHFSE